jgi:hypothetical protein
MLVALPVRCSAQRRCSALVPLVLPGFNSALTHPSLPLRPRVSLRGRPRPASLPAAPIRLPPPPPAGTSGSRSSSRSSISTGIG